MTYRETNISVSLVSSLLVLGYYLVNWLPMLRGGSLEEDVVFRLWIVVIVATVLLNIFGNILTSIVLAISHAIRTQSTEVPRFIEDERDRLIDLKGMRVAYIASSIGVFLAMLSFVLGQPALVMFSLIIFFAILAGVIEDVAKFYLYHRGVAYG
jgi:hypothetical protein